MQIAHWLIGPQLIGLIFVIAGSIQKRFPPKHINALYGYRMPSAMKNQQTWDVANHYSARFMIKCGFILLIAGIIITAILEMLNISKASFDIIIMVLLIFSSMGMALAIIVATEKHLGKIFDKPQ